jgi:hypothetical protein
MKLLEIVNAKYTKGNVKYTTRPLSAAAYSSLADRPGEEPLVSVLLTLASTLSFLFPLIVVHKQNMVFDVFIGTMHISTISLYL